MKKKILVSVLVLILTLGCKVTIVKANTTNSFKAELTSNSKTLKPEGEVTLILKVSDINMGEEGINALEGTIKYDKEIFEEIASANIISEGNWTTTYNDETSNNLYGKFLAVNLTAGTKEDSKILSVKFKVKKDVSKTQETQIDFENITSNDGVDLVNVGTKSVKLKVEVPEPEKPIVNEVKPEEKPSEAPGTLPQTGVTQTLTFAIIIIAVFGIAIGIRYKKMNDIK